MAVESELSAGLMPGNEGGALGTFYLSARALGYDGGMDESSFSRFTDRARKVMSLASDEAKCLHAGEIGTEHVLLGLIREGNGVAAHVLKGFGVELEAARIDAAKIVGECGEADSADKHRKGEKIAESAVAELKALGHNYVGTEHLLLALSGDPESGAAKVLGKFGIKLDDVRREVYLILGHFDLADAVSAKQQH